MPHFVFVSWESVKFPEKSIILWPFNVSYSQIVREIEPQHRSVKGFWHHLPKRAIQHCRRLRYICIGNCLNDYKIDWFRLHRWVVDDHLTTGSKYVFTPTLRPGRICFGGRSTKDGVVITNIIKRHRATTMVDSPDVASLLDRVISGVQYYQRPGGDQTGKCCHAVIMFQIILPYLSIAKMPTEIPREGCKEGEVVWHHRGSRSLPVWLLDCRQVSVKQLKVKSYYPRVLDDRFGDNLPESSRFSVLLGFVAGCCQHGAMFGCVRVQSSCNNDEQRRTWRQRHPKSNPFLLLLLLPSPSPSSLPRHSCCFHRLNSQPNVAFHNIDFGIWYICSGIS